MVILSGALQLVSEAHRNLLAVSLPSPTLAYFARPTKTAILYAGYSEE